MENLFKQLPPGRWFEIWEIGKSGGRSINPKVDAPTR